VRLDPSAAAAIAIYIDDTRPERPGPLFLTEEEVDKKFYDCVVPVLGGAKAEDLLKTLRRIETVSSVREIFSRLFF